MTVLSGLSRCLELGQVKLKQGLHQAIETTT